MTFICNGFYVAGHLRSFSVVSKHIRSFGQINKSWQ